MYRRISNQIKAEWREMWFVQKMIFICMSAFCLVMIVNLIVMLMEGSFRG